MASQIISFRFSDDEIEILEAMRRSSESVSQCGQRLLRERLGLGSVYNESTVRTQQLQEWLEQIVDAKMNYLVNSCQQIVDSRVDGLDARVKLLENLPKSVAKTRTKKSVDSSV